MLLCHNAALVYATLFTSCQCALITAIAHLLSLTQFKSVSREALGDVHVSLPLDVSLPCRVSRSGLAWVSLAQHAPLNVFFTPPPSIIDYRGVHHCSRVLPAGRVSASRWLHARVQHGGTSNQVSAQRLGIAPATVPRRNMLTRLPPLHLPPFPQLFSPPLWSADRVCAFEIKGKGNQDAMNLMCVTR